MTAKEIADLFINYHRWTDDLGVESDQYLLAKAYLALEARMEKLERVAEAGQELLKYLPNMEVLGAARYSAHLKTAMCFRDALKELEQE